MYYQLEYAFFAAFLNNTVFTMQYRSHLEKMAEVIPLLDAGYTAATEITGWRNDTEHWTRQRVNKTKQEQNKKRYGEQ